MMRTHFAGQRLLFGTTLVVATGALAVVLITVLAVMLALAAWSASLVVYPA